MSSRLTGHASCPDIKGCVELKASCSSIKQQFSLRLTPHILCADNGKALSKLKVSELKELLKANGLQVSGKKAVSRNSISPVM